MKQRTIGALSGGSIATLGAVGIPQIIESIPAEWGWPGALAVIFVTMAGHYGATVMEEVRAIRVGITVLKVKVENTEKTQIEHGRTLREVSEKLGKHSGLLSNHNLSVERNV